ncbi:ABC transporter substrate-binding protein, partial [Micrococcus sp. SIMBA_144]
PMDVNPFNDKKVREAMTHAINREALADIAMEGAAAPAGQFMPEGFDGNDPDLKPVSYAPELSKKLLAEAGYPDGFGFTIHCLNDRFSGDVRT